MKPVISGKQTMMHCLKIKRCFACIPNQEFPYKDQFIQEGQQSTVQFVH